RNRLARAPATSGLVHARARAHPHALFGWGSFPPPSASEPSVELRACECHVWNKCETSQPIGRSRPDSTGLVQPGRIERSVEADAQPPDSVEEEQQADPDQQSAADCSDRDVVIAKPPEGSHHV